MINKSSNAMTAKTKAIFAKRLKDSDYQNLLQKKSVAEIASYLKNDTYFNESLDGVNEKALHRGQLEVIIRNDLIHRLSKILRYGEKEDSFYNIVVTNSEISLIINCIRSIISGEFSSIIVKLPIVIEHEMCFDFKRLANCKTFPELLDIIYDTPYYKIVSKYHLAEMSEFDFVGLEEELQRHYYNSISKLVSKSFNNKNKTAIEEIFHTEVELDNISKIYRLKKYFNAPADKIKEMITPLYSRFSKIELDNIIENVEADHIYEYLMDTSYKSFIHDSRFMFIEHTAKEVKYNLNRKHMLFSNDAELVLLTYMTLMEIEIQNIIEIIEGVRYHIPSEQIKKMLVL